MTALLLIAGPSACFLAGLLYMGAPNWKIRWVVTLLFFSYVVWHSATVNHLLTTVAP